MRFSGNGLGVASARAVPDPHWTVGRWQPRVISSSRGASGGPLERIEGSDRATRSNVEEIQRSRILGAMAEEVAMRGASSVTVARVIARAGVSRRLFYELFADIEDCFLATFDWGSSRRGGVAVEAYTAEKGWREGIRAGLARAAALLRRAAAAGTAVRRARGGRRPARARASLAGDRRAVRGRGPRTRGGLRSSGSTASRQWSPREWLARCWRCSTRACSRAARRRRGSAGDVSRGRAAADRAARGADELDRAALSGEQASRARNCARPRRPARRPARSIAPELAARSQEEPAACA